MKKITLLLAVLLTVTFIAPAFASKKGYQYYSSKQVNPYYNSDSNTGEIPQ